jgi:hypothetical protein
VVPRLDADRDVPTLKNADPVGPYCTRTKSIMGPAHVEGVSLRNSIVGFGMVEVKVIA